MITEDHLMQLEKLLDRCAAHFQLLSDWEQGFCEEWCDKVAMYKQNVRVSDKQDAVFTRLDEKLRKAGV